MTIEEMNQRKRELGYNNQMISELSGVPLTTVQKVLSGTTTSPRRATIEALTRALSSGSDSAPRSKAVRQIVDENKGEALYRQYRYADEATSPAGRLSLLKEAMAAYGVAEKKTYTVSDMLSLPETFRAELIDGVFYDMAFPAPVHQLILGRLYYVLLPCVDRHPDCELYLSPSDVRLGSDNRTVVQPDLYIRCGSEESSTNEAGITTFVAPDFVAEILSPSSRAHDMIRKLNKYLDSGVREYWIIDPKEQRVIVYNFEKEEYLKSYTFDDTVPVEISGGECKVDFSYIREKVKKYL